MLKRLLHRAPVQRAGAYLLGRYLRLALGTTRWTLEGMEHLAPLLAGSPGIVAFWHENLPMLPELWLEFRRRGGAGPLYALASRHRDGQIISNILRQFGIGLVRGSSSRGGAAGLRTLLDVLKEGAVIGIVPDGPRGPRRKAAPGAVQLAAMTGAPLLAVGARTARRRILRSWDHMAIPLPFGRGAIVIHPALPVTRGTWESALPMLEQALTDVTERAERLCGH